MDLGRREDTARMVQPLACKTRVNAQWVGVRGLLGRLARGDDRRRSLLAPSGAPVYLGHIKALKQIAG